MSATTSPRNLTEIFASGFERGRFSPASERSVRVTAQLLAPAAYQQASTKEKPAA
jgi:hypothetical protein